jgi:hypothetical protein
MEDFLLIDFGCSRHMIEDRRWSPASPRWCLRSTFGDNGKGRVISVGTVKVSETVTLRRVALVKSLGFNLLSVSQLLDEGFKVCFKTGTSRVLDSQGGLV